MSTQTLVVSKFEDIGSRARLLRARPERDFEIDVDTDSRGEFFRLSVPADVDLEVLDCRPKDRHLLLMARSDGKPRFLCGHDERHWFTAAIPRAVTTVAQAKDALKPSEIRSRDAYLRQGEWFFLPALDLNIDESVVLAHELLKRGRGSKPHVLEEAVRLGGETVYTCARVPDGVDEARYQRYLRYVPASRRWDWHPRKRNPEVYARGRVTHPDHAPVVLKGWHRVLMNTEGRAPARRFVVFID